jgi:hypothetical protein
MFAIQPVTQEPGESVCGACCVAMLCDVSTETAMYWVGYGAVGSAKILKVLRDFGFQTPRKCVFGQPDSGLALALWRQGNAKMGHWVVFYDGSWFCPDRGLCNAIPAGWTCERFWSITRPVESSDDAQTEPVEI